MMSHQRLDQDDKLTWKTRKTLTKQVCHRIHIARDRYIVVIPSSSIDDPVRKRRRRERQTRRRQRAEANDNASPGSVYGNDQSFPRSTRDLRYSLQGQNDSSNYARHPDEMRTGQFQQQFRATPSHNDPGNTANQGSDTAADKTSRDGSR